MDLNGDGYIDLISGSWPGEIFIFRGGPGHVFGPPEMLKDKDGKIINVGGGVQKQPDGSIMITGNARFEKKDGKNVVIYHDQTIESTPEKPVMVTGCASAVHAVDWNGDGRIDLLVGDISGHVWFIPNEGTSISYAFGKPVKLKVEGKDLRVEGDAGPFVCDWDEDGKLDLLVGAGDGSVSFFRNVGSNKEPILSKPELLVGPTNIWSGDIPKTPRRGVRTKVCAVDWNGDGKLDLLVGDYTNQKPDLPEPTTEQKAEQEKAKKEIEAIQGKYRVQIDKIMGPNRIKDKDALDQAQKELTQIQQQMQKLYAKVPKEEESHGWVWLYLRK